MSAAEEGGRNSKAGKAAGKGGDAGEKRAALKGRKGAGQKRKEASADTAHLEKQMKGRTLRVVDGGLEDLGDFSDFQCGRRVVLWGVCGCPFCRKSVVCVLPQTSHRPATDQPQTSHSGRSRKKVNIFWDRENFPLAHDNLAPERETQNCPV